MKRVEVFAPKQGDRLVGVLLFARVKWAQTGSWEVVSTGVVLVPKGV